MKKLTTFALAGTSLAVALAWQQQGVAPPQTPPGGPAPQNADAAARGGAGQAFGGMFGRGGGGWLTGRGDAQRSGWVRTDSFLSVETIEKPGFELRNANSKMRRARATRSALGSVETAAG